MLFLLFLLRIRLPRGGSRLIHLILQNN